MRYIFGTKSRKSDVYSTPTAHFNLDQPRHLWLAAGQPWRGPTPASPSPHGSFPRPAGPRPRPRPAPRPGYITEPAGPSGGEN